MARFGEDAVYGPRVLVGAMSQVFGGSLWREGSSRAARVGGSDVTVFWWLALARRQFSGTCVLVGVRSQAFGGSLRRQGSSRAAHVGGSDVTVFWWLALARGQFTGRACWWE